MTGAVVGIAILLGLAAGVGYFAGYARGRGQSVEPAAPDRVTDEVFARVVDELKDCRGEIERYRRTVERLQRQRDGG